MNNLEGKSILVTGASSGIGRGIAICCSRAGANVSIVGRNEARLAETLAGMTGDGHSSFICDLTNDDSLKDFVVQLPQLDGIVHCAGIGQRIPAKMLTTADIDSVMNINFKAPVLLQSALLQQKKVKKGASIVFIASIASWSPSVGNSIYSASKGAIISYANCLALELSSRLIRVNCISPAMVWTELIKDNGITIEQLQEDEKSYPLKRYGTPDDIGNLAVYLLSDESSWMTGSNVRITGGGKLS